MRATLSDWPYHRRTMGSLSFGEILTIVVIILIIFGPNRLPEFARKVGEMIAWARKSMQDFTQSVQGELGDGMQPLSDLKREFDGARSDLTGAINSISTSAPTPTPMAPETSDDPDSSDGTGDDPGTGNDETAEVDSVDDAADPTDPQTGIAGEDPPDPSLPSEDS